MAFFLRRVGHGLLVLLAMATLVFFAVHVIGNPVDLLVDPQADNQDRARAIAALGLDQPLVTQYVHFIRHAAQGDLGNSFLHGTSAVALVLARLPATLELACSALLIALCLGFPLGLWAGSQPRHVTARLIRSAALLGFSLPTFWLGMMLILLCAVHFDWLPPGGRGNTLTVLGLEWSFLTTDGLRHLLLPALTLAIYKGALIIRLVAQGTEDELKRDYVRAARARGLSLPSILRRHVLKNLLIPLVTVLGMEFGSIIAFAIVTESIFGWPGMGKQLIDAVTSLDRPVIVAYLLVASALFVSINLLVDIAYGLLDPRVRQAQNHG